MLEEKVTGIWARVKNKISYAAKVGAVGIGVYMASEMVAPKMASAQSVESKIAFVSDRDGDDEIYIMNADGSGVTKITSNSVGDWGPAWSPDGRKIAFTRIQDGEERIYVMNADGSNQRRITNNSNITWEAYPKWSPDGQKIAFTVDWGIFSINIDGTNQINLTNSPSRQERIPTWSPDGRSIAYESGNSRIPYIAIKIMNADGSNQRVISNSIYDDFSPSWSSQGDKIAFMSKPGGRNGGDIFVMNSDGTGRTRLTFDEAFNDFPDWSPDGRQIVFFSLRDGDFSNRNFNIYKIDSDGRNLARLTDNPAADFSPAWSPFLGPRIPPDTTPPYLANLSPDRNAPNVPRNTNISADVLDTVAVDGNSLEMLVENSRVNPTTISSINNGFRLFYNPPADFGYGQVVDVVINARDTSNNPLGNNRYSFTIVARPANLPPAAGFTLNPESGRVPLTVNFDASLSFDSDGNITRYEWDWQNDGVFDSTGLTQTHTFNNPERYTVALRVTDDRGGTDTERHEVNALEQIVRGIAGTLYNAGTNAPIVAEKISSFFWGTQGQYYSGPTTTTNNNGEFKFEFTENDLNRAGGVSKRELKMTSPDVEWSAHYSNDEFQRQTTINQDVYVYPNRSRSDNPSLKQFFFLEKRDEPDISKLPVMLVHGVEGTSGYWHDLVGRLERDFDVWQFYYPGNQSILASATLLGEGIENVLQTGRNQKVNIVAHSMGGLVARAYSLTSGAETQINKILMIGTPNFGSRVAHRMATGERSDEFLGTVSILGGFHPRTPAYDDMSPGSEFLWNINKIGFAQGRAGINQSIGARNYFVIAGTKDIDVLRGLHIESPDHQDGVVSITNASLLQYGVNLGLLPINHIEETGKDLNPNSIEYFQLTQSIRNFILGNPMESQLETLIRPGDTIPQILQKGGFQAKLYDANGNPITSNELSVLPASQESILRTIPRLRFNGINSSYYYFDDGPQEAGYGLGIVLPSGREFRVVRSENPFLGNNLFRFTLQPLQTLMGEFQTGISFPKPGKIWVSDDISTLADVGTVDRDPRNGREFVIRWDNSDGPYTNFHAYVSTNGGQSRFLGQTKNPSADYFRWVETSSTLTHRDFRSGPQFENRYQFSVWGIRNNAPNSLFGNTNVVRFEEDVPTPTSTLPPRPPSPTNTPRPPTPAYTLTRTPTRTPTWSPTPTRTFTPTYTHTPTNTLTPTSGPTNTPTPIPNTFVSREYSLSNRNDIITYLRRVDETGLEEKISRKVIGTEFFEGFNALRTDSRSLQYRTGSGNRYPSGPNTATVRYYSFIDNSGIRPLAAIGLLNQDKRPLSASRVLPNVFGVGYTWQWQWYEEGSGLWTIPTTIRVVGLEDIVLGIGRFEECIKLEADFDGMEIREWRYRGIGNIKSIINTTPNSFIPSQSFSMIGARISNRIYGEPLDF